MTVVRKDVILWRLRFSLRQSCVPWSLDVRNMQGLAGGAPARMAARLLQGQANSDRALAQTCAIVTEMYTGVKFYY
jgi:hypothetical protein